MRNFRIRDLDAWEAVELDVDHEDAGGPERRTLVFQVMASGPVSVFASDDLAVDRLVGRGEGLLRVKLAVSGPASFRVEADQEGTLAFVSRRTEPQVVPDKLAVSFATIEPRGAGASMEVRRMQLWMQLNERRRDAILDAERARLRSELERVAETVKASASVSAAGAKAAAADEQHPE